MTKKFEADISPYTLRRLRHQVAKSGRIDEAVEREILALSEDQRVDLFRPATNCRICSTKGASEVANKMLSYGATHKDIMTVLAPMNSLRPKNDQITLNSIGHHARNHFPLEEAANAVYRKLIEKRAEEAERDFINGVGGAVTALGFLDVVVQKGFENLIQEETVVSPDTAVRAAKELAAIESQRNQDDTDIAEVMVKMNEVIEAVRMETDPETWGRIRARLSGEPEKPPLWEMEAIEVPVEEEEVVGYDPGDPDLDFSDDEDDLEDQ